MVSERVTKIFEVLHASNTQIASYAEVDRSSISRIRSGGRVPKMNSISVAKLIQGIFLFADNHNRLDDLCRLIGCPDNLTANEIKEALLLWCYEGYQEPPKKPVRVDETLAKKRAGSAFRSFGAKLDAVMTLADISNVRLAKQLHVDASTVSRFRNGLRTPKSNQRLTNEICTTLFARIQALDRSGELCALLGLSETPQTVDDDLFDRFRNWLCDFQGSDSGALVERLLEDISALQSEAPFPLPALEETVPEGLLHEKARTYYGTEGLRTAVLRFLGNAITHRAKELLLYSDQKMDWLVGDPAFRLKWAALMFACVKAGIRIRIVHNLDRNIPEMLAAIQSWLPLYLSGMIESFYCKKEENSRFSHTLFLCPGLAGVFGVHLIGREDEGAYRYETETDMLEDLRKGYDKLLSLSKPLVWVYRGQEQETVYVGSKVSAIGNTLSLATMPESVIRSMIGRYRLAKDEAAAVLCEWSAKKSRLESALSKGFVYEYIAVAEENALFSGLVSADVRSAALCYSPEEYREHIKNIIALSKAYANYRFYSLPEHPFPNTLVLCSESAVAVTRLLSPEVTFAFSHPSMCDAFWEYAQHLKEQYRQDRTTVRRELEKYL